MTTLITTDTKPGLPKPSAYSHHLDDIAHRLKVEAEWRAGRRAARRRLHIDRALFVAAAVSVTVLVVVLYLHAHT